MTVSINPDLAMQMLGDFKKEYPAVLTECHVTEKAEYIYGPKAAKIIGTAKGLFHPSTNKAIFISSNIRDASDMRRTIQHEIIGHYGTLTYEKESKKALMSAIRGSRESPDLSNDWAKIDRIYSGVPESIKCEEMFCLHAEEIKGKPISDPAHVKKVWAETVMGGRTMGKADLQALVHGVADGLAKGLLFQKTFPSNDQSQWRVNDPLETAHDEAKALLGSKAKVYPAQTAEGAYKGPLVAHTTTHVLQQVSATQTVAHDKAAFAQIPGINGSKPVQVKYEQGKAEVHPPRALTREKETSRGR